MKYLVGIVLTLVCFSSCSNTEENHILIEHELIGKWKQVEYFEDDSTEWTPVDDGFIVEFKSNGQFISQGSCENATFKIENNEIYWYCNQELQAYQMSFSFYGDDHLLLISGFVTDKMIRVPIE